MRLYKGHLRLLPTRADGIQESIKHFTDRLFRALRKVRTPDHHPRCFDVDRFDHPALYAEEKIENAMSGGRKFPTPEHKEYMARQRKRSGFELVKEEKKDQEPGRSSKRRRSR